MKIKEVLFVLFILIATGLTAQHKPYQFGFKAGVNMGWYSSSEDIFENNGVDIGANWGFIADLYLMENYSVTTGFNVLFLNGTMRYPDLYTPEYSNHQLQGMMEREYRTKYIEIPILFTMKTNEINNLRYYGQLGIAIGILITADGDDTFTPDDGSPSETEKHNIYDEMRFSRESFIIGAGVEIPLSGSTYLRTGIVYDNAIFNVLKDDNKVYTSVKNNGRNNAISLEVNILF